MDNEPELTWSSEMHSLIQEMIHYMNGLPDGEPADSQKAADFEKRYDEAIAKACRVYLTQTVKNSKIYSEQ